MRISHFFIDRPIFAAVLSVVMVILGGVSFGRLPVAQYPEIAPPTVNISAAYPGASAQVVAETVATPIEQEVNGVEDMLYMSSTSADDGSYTLTVTFDIGSDMDIPLRGGLGMQIGSTYFSPGDESVIDKHQAEGWNVSISMIYRPGMGRGNRYRRPMFNVADNGSFFVFR